MRKDRGVICCYKLSLLFAPVMMHVSLRIPDIKIWICSKGIVAMHLRQLKTLCLQLRPELGRVGVNLEIKKLRYHFKTVLRQKTRYDTWTLNDLRYAADSNSKKSARLKYCSQRNSPTWLIFKWKLELKLQGKTYPEGFLCVTNRSKI